MVADTTLQPDVFLADPVHSSVIFSVTSMGNSTFRSSFGVVRAALRLPPAGPASLTGVVEVNSISITEPPEFRGHLLSDAFFSAEAYPEMIFDSGEVVLGEDGEAVVAGEITLRGIARPVTARGRWARPEADPSGRLRAHLSLEATIDRREFGMTWNQELPDGQEALANLVTVTAELRLVSEA